MTSHSIIRSAGTVLVMGLIMLGCGGRPALNSLDARQLYEGGMELYKKGDYFKATEYFQALVYDFPGESLVDTAQYYLALSYFGNDDYILARAEFNRLVNYYPASVYAQHSLFMQAVSLYEGAPDHHGLDQTEILGARQLFEDFIIDFPESELLGDVQAYLKKANDRLVRKDYESGVVYYRMHAFEAANIYFQRVIDQYTTNKLAGSSLYFMGQISFEWKKYSDAVSHFENFLTLHPNHEWAEKAKKILAEATFKSAEADYQIEQLGQAKTKLTKFLEDYPDSKLTKKAIKLLDKIGDLPDDQTAESSGEKS